MSEKRKMLTRLFVCMLTILLLSNCISGCQKGEQGNAGAKDDQISIQLEENYLEIFQIGRAHV